MISDQFWPVLFSNKPTGGLADLAGGLRDVSAHLLRPAGTLLYK